ncbi:Cytochrome c oxidase subunit 6A, mitochondrial [Cytospora mali]|uniref:Cytochrome c oxidase subunit 6A, mitochondrial n=1 Tax=Cytospora mali TaxID=578113 RepID=A0A194UZB9_CYTMA|nr:Cytochrome c oxidase subunit 6A, mitochondrial [Valsa mali var. pyri (nom. inval.)]
MFPQRQILRSAPRFLRAPAQRRLMSSGPVKAGENAFIKERQAVKDHAAGTTGDMANTKYERRLTIVSHENSGCIPALALASVNCYWLWNEHWEHWEHLPPLEERVEYPYQNIRTRNFPWGDGDKTIFWNDKVNYHNKDKSA